MQLKVPYYSQFIDVDSSFWMLRACGAVALKEVVEYFGNEAPKIIDICDEAKEKGGYHLTNGWVHDYLVDKAKKLGCDAYRKEGLDTTDDLIDHLKKGFPVIVSVEKRVLEQRRFHIIVLVGYEEENDFVQSFYYHESESTDAEKGQYRVCDKDTFMNFWRGKAIFISPKLA